MSNTLHILTGVLTVLHIGAGLLCLGVGPVVLAATKGSPRHRAWGRVFLRLIGVMAATAFGLLLIRFNAFFFVLATFSFYLAFSGFRVLSRKRPDRGQTAKPLDWAAAVLTVIAGAGGIAANAAGVLHGDPLFVATMLGGAVMVALYDLSRFWRPLDRARQPHLWLFEHMTKLIGSYIAVVAAFSATVLTFLPVPLRQLWPAAVGVPLLTLLVLRYRQKFQAVPRV